MYSVLGEFEMKIIIIKLIIIGMNIKSKLIWILNRIYQYYLNLLKINNYYAK